MMRLISNSLDAKKTFRSEIWVDNLSVGDIAVAHPCQLGCQFKACNKHYINQSKRMSIVVWGFGARDTAYGF